MKVMISPTRIGAKILQQRSILLKMAKEEASTLTRLSEIREVLKRAQTADKGALVHKLFGTPQNPAVNHKHQEHASLLLVFLLIQATLVTLDSLDSKWILQVMAKLLFVIEIKYSHAGIDFGVISHKKERGEIIKERSRENARVTLLECKLIQATLIKAGVLRRKDGAEETGDRAYDGLMRRGPFVNQRELSIQPGEETHCKLLVTEATLISGNEMHAQVRYTSPRDIVYVYSRQI
ncbi:hypothetical protein P5673_011698 [Acropora cervicornis]|uniref:Uncharacterized protein n=1 Tax=Acropora cervicornis TaxID=6130 RepID=A0AAD9QPF0_ACRCE|nr:hypothetical protein P5673_011698 [Acropora cervicornis]